MEAHNSSAAGGNGISNNQEQPQRCACKKLDEMIAGDSADFITLKSLISEIEKSIPDDIDTISVAYDYFLSNFPLCHWYWEKYAYHKEKLCGALEAVKIFERGVKAAECSVGIWVDYFKFGTSFFGDPSDVRRLFGRGLSSVGKDYFCHVLWDEYLKYEFNQEGWSFLAQSYIEALKFPSKKLHFYYDNFKKFVANLEEEMGYEHSWNVEVEGDINKEEISLVVRGLLDSSDRSIKFKALNRYKYIGNQLYQEARLLDEEIKSFEINIRRRYFEVTPLDDDELTNWHHYLDFIEKQEDLDWAVKLYERCLISCANYPEFWIRYVEFMECKRGRQLAVSVLDRATQIFLKNVPEIQFFNARFKEKIGDADGARKALLECDAKTDSSFIESVIKQANMEKRLGNLAAASATYEKGLQIASEKQKLHILPTLYVNFARLTFMISDNADAARDIIIRGIQHVPHCRSLLEELIKFAMIHEGASQVNILEPIIAEAITPPSQKSEGLNAKDREDISYLFLEFVDFCGTVHDVIRAWIRHFQLFPKFMRTRALCKKPISSNLLLNAAGDQSQSLSLTGFGLGLEQASKTQSSHLIRLAENNDVRTSPVLEDNSMQVDDNHAKEKLQRRSPEVADVSKEDTSQDNDRAHNSIQRPGDYHSGSVESTADLTCLPAEDKQEPIEVTTDLIHEVRTSDSPQRANIVSDKDRTENRENHMVAEVYPNPESSSRTDEVSHQTLTTARQSPLPSPPVSYPQQNILQSNIQTNWQHGQTPQDQPTNQMLQYQYYQQQQHFLQQQYQRSTPQLQQNYAQPPSYQMQPQQQQSQQHAYQQQYAQQMQQYYQQYYYQQNPQLAYQMQQQGYQNSAHGQELLLQQYQLYQQGYAMQPLYQGHHQMQENMQKCQQVTPEPNSTRSLTQHQQDQDVATPDFDGAHEPSESSHLQGQSPKVA